MTLEEIKNLKKIPIKFVDDLYDKFKVDYSILFSIVTDDISILRELLIDEIVN
jgi:hypothetical protein